MEQSKKHIVIVAGEASGDAHGARLVDAIKTLDSSISFSGLGGQKMAQSGVDLYSDLTKIAVIGFFEILKHIKEFKKLFRLVLYKVQETKAQAVILVDYPGFNLRLAKALKKSGVKVLYYISPQVWAWKEKRVELIRKNVDKMIVLFEFEKEFYAKHDIDVVCVGHPLVEEITIQNDKHKLLKNIGLDPTKKTIGLLPGSRTKEIIKLFPLMARCAQDLYQKNPDLQFLVLRAQTIDPALIDEHMPNQIPITIIDKDYYDSVNACDLCLVASGTATLEVAILNKPMIVIYKTSLITWLLAKFLIKISCIGLVNVVAQKKIVPECVQFDASEINIVSETIAILSDDKRIKTIKNNLSKVKASLGSPGASMRAAKEIVSFVSSIE